MRIFAWSRGYVAFYTVIADNGLGLGSTSVSTFHSADGLHWTSGSSFGFDEAVSISNVVEGPAGLLAVSKSIPAVCGGPPDVRAVWRSADGVSWHQVAVFTVHAGAIDAGSAGYVAIGNTYDGHNPAWISSDGATWTHVDLSASAFKGIDGIQSGTAFAGGFVLAGTTFGEMGGCGGTLTALKGALWWSADGGAWSRDALSEVVSGDRASMSVGRISDGALLATETSSTGEADPVRAYWTSADGRTWKSISLPSSMDRLANQRVTNGKRGLIVSSSRSGTEPAAVYAFQDDLSVTELIQTGSLPDPNEVLGLADGQVALGPTMLVVFSRNGSTVWVGVPGH